MRNVLSSVAIVLLALVAGASSAHGDRTRVDWERGLLIGRGIAVGDLRSPSRQLARVKAERQAKDQCRKLLLKSLSGMRWAEAGKSPDEAQHEGLDSTVFELHTDYGTDGSVVVEMALPLDALRALAYGPDALQATSGSGPAALLIDARASGVKPALGYVLRGQSGDYRGPTLFFTSEKDARKHAGVGKEAPLLVAKASSKQDRKGGAILVETDAFQKLTASRPLIAIIWRDQK